MTALVVSACTPTVDPTLADVARGYAEALVPALHADSLALLREVAVPDEVDRVKLYVWQSLNEKNERMAARLVGQEIVRTKMVNASAAYVDADEVWTIRYLSSKDGHQLRSTERTDRVRYNLTRIDGRWYVSSVAFR